jgi:type IV pilus assembly protein PilX
MIRRHSFHPWQRQRGVALFVALIAMVLLSIAGIALVRSVDTTSGVAGNIAFRMGSTGPVNDAIEIAIDRLFRSKTILTYQHDVANGYYALLQAGEKPNGIPAVLAGDYATMSSNYSGAGLPAAVVDANTKMEVRYVIERLCKDPGTAGPWAPTIAICDTLPPKVSGAGTDNKPAGKTLTLPAIPNYRVTVRVDLPNSSTTSIAQAILR